MRGEILRIIGVMSFQISVVMPALNEEANLGRAVESALDAFARLSLRGEIILVDDGSTDGTTEIGKALQRKHPFLRLLRHESPQGIGRSFWDGVQLAQGEVVTLLPGDGENDGYEILRYLPLMEQVDVVVPFVFNRGARSALRAFVSRFYRAVVNLSFGTSLNYLNGTVMYRRCLLGEITLRSNGFFYQTELLVKCLRAGYLYAEVPYGLGAREAGESKALIWKNISRVIGDYLRTLASVRGVRKLPARLAPESVSAARRRQFAPDPLPPAAPGSHAPFLLGGGPVQP